MKKTKFLFV
jgi:enoyl-CoA hydratase/carnithine racemase